MRHRGPISKFWLVAGTGGVVTSASDEAVDDWIHFLVNRHSRHLHDFKLSGQDSYALPQCFFTSFQHLRHLHLFAVKVELPPPTTFKGFTELVTLTLQFVPNVLHILPTFLSTSPMLEVLHLEFEYYEKIPRLDIVAPNLEKLCFVGSFRSIYLKCPRIKEVVLDYQDYEFKGGEDDSNDINFKVSNAGGSNSNLVKFLCQIPSIERMSLEWDSPMAGMCDVECAPMFWFLAI